MLIYIAPVKQKFMFTEATIMTRHAEKAMT